MASAVLGETIRAWIPSHHSRPSLIQISTKSLVPISGTLVRKGEYDFTLPIWQGRRGQMFFDMLDALT